MALTQSEVQKIHNGKLASFGKKYYSNDEKIYEGTKEGRLQLIIKAEKTTTTEIENIRSKEVQGVLEELNTKVSTIEIDYITNIQLIKAKEETRCLAIAMSIIF